MTKYLLIGLMAAFTELVCQDFIHERVYENSEMLKITDFSNINIFLLNQQSLLITYIVYDSVKETEKLAVKKIAFNGDITWEKYINWPHKLIPVSVSEASGGDIAILCNMGKYYTQIYDYTPAVVLLDKDGNFQKINVDTVSSILRKNNYPGVTFEKDGKYINISLFKNFLLLKEFDADCIFSCDRYLDTIDNYHTPKCGYAANDGFYIAGNYYKNDYEKTGTFAARFDRDYRIQWNITDTSETLSHQFYYACKSSPEGIAVMSYMTMQGENDTSNQKIVLKKFDGFGNIKGAYYYENYWIWPYKLLSLEKNGYLVLADSIRKIKQGKYENKLCLLRLDIDGNILWKTARGEDSINTKIYNGVHGDCGDLFFIGSKSKKLYYIHVRDNTLGVEEKKNEGALPFHISVSGNRAYIKTEASQTGRIYLSDISGRQLKNIYCNDNFYEMDLSGLSAGIYFITILSPGGSCYTEKLLRY